MRNSGPRVPHIQNLWLFYAEFVTWVPLICKWVISPTPLTCKWVTNRLFPTSRVRSLYMQSLWHEFCIHANKSIYELCIYVNASRTACSAYTKFVAHNAEFVTWVQHTYKWVNSWALHECKWVTNRLFRIYKIRGICICRVCNMSVWLKCGVEDSCIYAEPVTILYIRAGSAAHMHIRGVPAARHQFNSIQQHGTNSQFVLIFNVFFPAAG